MVASGKWVSDTVAALAQHGQLEMAKAVLETIAGVESANQSVRDTLRLLRREIEAVGHQQHGVEK